MVNVHCKFHVVTNCLLQGDPLKALPRHVTFTQNDETCGSIEPLQPYPIVAAHALIQIGTTVISAFVYR
jgi:hypothetical protein